MDRPNQPGVGIVYAHALSVLDPLPRWFGHYTEPHPHSPLEMRPLQRFRRGQ